MIFAGSRYTNALVIPIQDAAGNSFPAVYQRRDFDATAFQFDFYTVKQGDRLDAVAYSIYGDAQLWWVLARANPEVFYPDSLKEGTRIRIPYPRFVR